MQLQNRLTSILENWQAKQRENATRLEKYENYRKTLSFLNEHNHDGMYILTNDGTIELLADYQKRKNLADNKVGRFFGTNERHLNVPFLLAEPLLIIADAYREGLGRPVIINSAFRSEAYQLTLKSQGYKTATFSPHCMGIAFDFDANSRADVFSKVSLLQRISERLNIPIRLGYNQYLASGQTFIHCDVAPYYFGKGKLFAEVGESFKDWANPIHW